MDIVYERPALPYLAAPVRPDGYVGFRGGTAEIRQLAAWLALINADGRG